jgi:hypothetical protein
MSLAFGRPNNPPGQVIHMRGQANLLRWRHLSPDRHLLRIEGTQAAAQALR